MMSGRAIISCFSPPSTPCSPQTPLSRRTHHHLTHATPPISPFPSHLLSRQSHLFAAGRCGRRVWANVKSQKNVSESPKYENVVKARGLDDDVEVEAKWWQVFPKRWVIVVLCFSAFLLCNMDRVCNSAYSFFFVFQLHCYFLSACNFVRVREKL